MQARRDKQAATKFLCKRLKGLAYGLFRTLAAPAAGFPTWDRIGAVHQRQGAEMPPLRALGSPLTALVQRECGRAAYVPRVVITDTLASYGAALREVLPSVEHRQHKRLNNRAEHSHQPTRERERRMRRCKDPGHAQRFRAAYGPIASHFRPRRHRLTASAYRQHRNDASATWREVTGVAVAA